MFCCFTCSQKITRLLLITKNDWVTTALDRLLEEGSANVKVERLARDLGVTKGSFYWHFKDRADLLQQAAASWEERQLSFLDTLKNTDYESPEARLKGLFAFIDTKDARHDAAMRLWARRSDWINDLVAKIDRVRLGYCEDIFIELGFDGDAARLRAHLVYYYQVAEQTLSYKEPEEIRQRLNELRFDLLVTNG